MAEKQQPLGICDHDRSALSRDLIQTLANVETFDLIDADVQPDDIKWLMDKGDMYAMVVIPPGKSTPLHAHPETEESYYILKGQARMALGEEEAIIGPGQIVLIPAPKPHKIINVGQEDLEFLAYCVPAWEPTNTDWLEEEGGGGIPTRGTQ